MGKGAAALKTQKKSAAKKTQASIGIIGGSGLYAMKGLPDCIESRIRRP